MTGKNIRLERIIDRNTHKTVIVPMDHGVTVGPIEGLENLRQAVSNVVAGGVNAVLMHKGMPRFSHRQEGKDTGLILHLSAGTAMSPDPNAKTLVCSVEEAMKRGADAVSMHINLGAETELQMLEQLGYISEQCYNWQMPLLAMMYTRGAKIDDECDVENVKHAARVAAELGADMVKVSYTGSKESFQDVVEGCPIPIVIAGGEKMNSDEEIFQVVYDALQAGASGLSIGRNAFQHKYPDKITKALCKMVHENATVDNAVSIMNE